MRAGAGPDEVPGAPPGPAGAPAGRSLEARVDEGVRRGVEFLFARYDAKEAWGGAMGTGVYGGVGVAYPYATGPTAFCCFALLKAGVPPDEPRMKRALGWLRVNHRIPGVTYELATLLLAVAEAGGARRCPDFRRPPLRAERTTERYKPPKGCPIPKERWTWICDLAARLLVFQSSNGGWRYYPSDFHSGGIADTSSTQFALLALSTASRIGYAVPEAVFEKARAFLLASQEREGPSVPRAIHLPGGEAEALDRCRGFPYIAGSDVMPYRRVTGGMTAAGLASLLLVREELPPDPRTETAILDAFAWVGRYFAVEANPGAAPFLAGSYAYCWLYALERCGDLMGRELIGGRSWFAEGARHLLAQQRADGAIPDPTCMQPQDVLGTAFALLFLTRATRPVSGGD